MSPGSCLPPRIVWRVPGDLSPDTDIGTPSPIAPIHHWVTRHQHRQNCTARLLYTGSEDRVGSVRDKVGSTSFHFNVLMSLKGHQQIPAIVSLWLTTFILHIWKCGLSSLDQSPANWDLSLVARNREEPMAMPYILDINQNSAEVSSKYLS